MFAFAGPGETREEGFLLVEVMAAVVILSIVTIAFVNSAYTALRVERMSEVGDHAQNLVVSRVERLAGIPFVLLTTSFNETNTATTSVGTSLTFYRTTTVTVNADGSKSIAVSITSNSPLLPRPVTLTSRFAPWELT